MGEISAFKGDELTAPGSEQVGVSEHLVEKADAIEHLVGGRDAVD